MSEIRFKKNKFYVTLKKEKEEIKGKKTLLGDICKLEGKET